MPPALFADSLKAVTHEEQQPLLLPKSCFPHPTPRLFGAMADFITGTGKAQDEPGMEVIVSQKVRKFSKIDRDMADGYHS